MADIVTPFLKKKTSVYIIFGTTSPGHVRTKCISRMTDYATTPHSLSLSTNAKTLLKPCWSLFAFLLVKVKLIRTEKMLQILQRSVTTFKMCKLIGIIFKICTNRNN